MIDILLTTFNGENYLDEQLESLLTQKFSEWRLMIRDDGSTDETISIMQSYLKRFPKKITIYECSEGNLGPTESFLFLMRKSKSAYVAFCDQDDIWEVDKLAKQITKMRESEENYGNDLPLLVHTNLKVVDNRLNLLSNSLWDYQNLNPCVMAEFNRLLVQNFVTGCACLINRQLLKMALTVNDSKKIIMHDWWLALIAAAKGKIISMPEPLVKYRQHSSNDVGATKWGSAHTLDTIREGIPQLKKRLLATKVQADELLRIGILGAAEEEVVKRYIDAFDLNWLERRMEIFNNGYIKYGLARNIGMFLAL